MGEDREGHPIWYDNFNYDFKGKLITCISPAMCYHTLCDVYTPPCNDLTVCRTTPFSEDG